MCAPAPSPRLCPSVQRLTRRRTAALGPRDSGLKRLQHAARCQLPMSRASPTSVPPAVPVRSCARVPDASCCVKSVEHVRGSGGHRACHHRPPCFIVVASHSVHAVYAVQGGLVANVAAVFPRPCLSTSPTSVVRCAPPPVTTTPPVISTAVALAIMAFFPLPDQDTPWYYISSEYLLCSESHD